MADVVETPETTELVVADVVETPETAPGEGES